VPTGGWGIGDYENNFLLILTSPQPAPTNAPAASQASGSSPFELAERYLSPVLSPFATLGRATKPQRHAVVLLVCAKVTIGAAELPDLLPLAAIAPRDLPSW
jgi:hypothetical protein